MRGGIPRTDKENYKGYWLLVPGELFLLPRILSWLFIYAYCLSVGEYFTRQVLIFFGGNLI